MSVFDRIREIGIVPVVEIADAGAATHLVDALAGGGVPCAEITFRTAAAGDAIRRTRDALPDVLVGAGTVLTPAQVDEAAAADAGFVVSPGFGRAVVERCLEVGLPVIPGAYTPTDVQMAMEAGLTTVKLFPAELAGGIPYLRALGGPFGGVRFLPTGGIDASNLGAYLALPNVLACGGSWLVRRDLVVRGDWAAVRRLASDAAAIVRDARDG